MELKSDEQMPEREVKKKLSGQALASRNAKRREKRTLAKKVKRGEADPVDTENASVVVESAASSAAGPDAEAVSHPTDQGTNQYEPMFGPSWNATGLTDLDSALDDIRERNQRLLSFTVTGEDFIIEAARGAMRWSREVTTKVCGESAGAGKLPDCINEILCETCLTDNHSKNTHCINPKCALMLPVKPVHDTWPEDVDLPTPRWQDRPGATPPDFKLIPEGPSQRVDWWQVIHRDDAMKNSRENSQRFADTLNTLSDMQQSTLADTKICKTDAQLVWKSLGTEVPLSLITQTTSFFPTPGAWFYTPQFIGWKPATDTVDASVGVHVTDTGYKGPCDTADMPMKPDFKDQAMIRGLIGTSSLCASMVQRDSLRNCVNTTANHEGVYFEEADGDRRACCLGYCTMQACGPVVPHNPGLLTNCVIEVLAPESRTGTHKGQRYCLEQYVCVTGFYLHLYPATSLQTKGQWGWYNVHETWFQDFPKVGPYMQSEGYDAAVKKHLAALALSDKRVLWADVEADDVVEPAASSAAGPDVDRLEVPHADASLQGK
jgi:hypothetical protein